MSKNECCICTIYPLVLFVISIAFFGIELFWLNLLFTLSLWLMGACIYYTCLDTARIQDHNRVYPFHDRISITIV